MIKPMFYSSMHNYQCDSSVSKDCRYDRDHLNFLNFVSLMDASIGEEHHIDGLVVVALVLLALLG